MTPATVYSAATAAGAGGNGRNHYYANISQQHDQCKKKYMFKHGHRCYASYTFDRLQFRTEARLPKVAAAAAAASAVAVLSMQHCKASAAAAQHATACAPP